MTTTEEVCKRKSAASMALKIKKDPVRAMQLALEAVALFDEVETTDEQRGDLAHGLAGLLRDLGELERCEPLAVLAIDLEAALPEPRALILGTRHMFYATYLHGLRRFGEAAQHARSAVAIYATGIHANDPELAYLRARVAAIIADAESPAGS